MASRFPSTFGVWALLSLSCTATSARNSPGRWRFVPLRASMAEPRANHSATALHDGTVLVVGGEDIGTRAPTRSVDRIDPRTGEIQHVEPLPVALANHQAVALRNGEVLVMGGGRSAPIGLGSGEAVTARAFLFDPGSARWRETAAMGEGRSHFQAVLLSDGSVLAIAGASGRTLRNGVCNGAPNCGPLADTLASAERYLPEEERWVPAGTLAEDRMAFTATDVDGEVHVVGGLSTELDGRRTSERFSLETGEWTLGPELRVGRFFHAAAALENGALLIAGGKVPNVRFLAEVELMARQGPSISRAALSERRTVPRLIALPSGAVLSVGGFAHGETLDSVRTVELFTPATNRWVRQNGLRTPRAGHSATYVGGGVLVCGGFAGATTHDTCEWGAFADHQRAGR